MAQTVYLNFGMVAIPAKLSSAQPQKKLSHPIHTDCGSRTPPQIQEIKGMNNPSRTGYGRTIEAVEFVDDSQIDVRRYKESYFLSPQDTGVKAFTIFLKAMSQVGVVAIAKLTYREREVVSVVRPYDGVMLLQILHDTDELPAEPEGVIFDTNTLLQAGEPKEVAISDKELELARKLIRQMSR